MALKEVLDLAAGITAVHNVGGDDVGVAGRLCAGGDAAKATASIKQDLIAIEVLNLEQPRRAPNRLNIVIAPLAIPDM